MSQITQLNNSNEIQSTSISASTANDVSGDSIGQLEQEVQQLEKEADELQAEMMELVAQLLQVAQEALAAMKANPPPSPEVLQGLLGQMSTLQSQIEPLSNKLNACLQTLQGKANELMAKLLLGDPAVNQAAGAAIEQAQKEAKQDQKKLGALDDKLHQLLINLQTALSSHGSQALVGLSQELSSLDSGINTKYHK
jgi:hypothetical protein